MERAVIDKAYFERALLFLCGKGDCGDIRFASLNGKKDFLPLYCEKDAESFKVCFDLASGYSGKPLPCSAWELKFDGDIELAFDGERDFSGNGGEYKIALICDELGANLFSCLKPTKDSFKLKCADILLKAFFKAAEILPKRHKTVLFTSQSRNELSGNEKFVYDEIMKREELKSSLNIRFSFTESGGIGFYLKTAWLLGRSDTVILDDYHPIVYRFKYKKSVKIAQLWHACGAFKTFGYSRLGKEGALRFDGNAHRCYTHVFVSGEGVRKYYAEAFGVPMKRVYATGVARCDSFAAKKRQKNERFTILFAPTFRGNGKESAYYPYNKIDNERLAALCRKNNMQIIFKMHPFIKEKVRIEENQRDVLFDESDKREINDLLPEADLIITDYSSVVYEASLLDIPMLFYVFDLDEYTKKRDFYQPFCEFAPGKIVCTFDELINALESKSFDSEKVSCFKQANFSGDIGKASAKIVDILFEE